MNLASRRKRPIGTLHSQTVSSKLSHNRPKLLHHLTSKAVQRIPSSIRLRRTQSTPRIAIIDYANPIAERYNLRRHSSNPSIGSPLRYPVEIPQMHSTSATPPTSQYGRATSTSVRMCGRGDLITAQGYLYQSPFHASPQPTKHYDNTLSLPAQSLSAVSGISPTNISNVAPHHQQQPNDYFASVHAATHVLHEKDPDIDDEEDLKGERENAGPRIDECPILQDIFAKMDAPDGEYSSDGSSSDDYSTSNYLRRGLRHESILVEAGNTGEQIVEMFGTRRGSK
jgi:hypothetical protein